MIFKRFIVQLSDLFHKSALCRAASVGRTPTCGGAPYRPAANRLFNLIVVNYERSLLLFVKFQKEESRAASFPFFKLSFAAKQTFEPITTVFIFGHINYSANFTTTKTECFILRQLFLLFFSS
jgi:hypothetical protein